MRARNEPLSVRTAVPSVSKENTVRYGRTGIEVPPSSVRIRASRYGHDTDEADGYGRHAVSKRERLPRLAAGIDRTRNLQ